MANSDSDDDLWEPWWDNLTVEDLVHCDGPVFSAGPKNIDQNAKTRCLDDDVPTRSNSGVSSAFAQLQLSPETSTRIHEYVPRRRLERSPPSTDDETTKSDSDVSTPITTPGSVEESTSGESASTRSAYFTRTDVTASEDFANLSDPSSPFLTTMFRSIHLDTHVISHDPLLQLIFDEHHISWGVQWELHRGLKLGLWTGSDIEDAITRLEGSNKDIHPRVFSLLGKNPQGKHLDDSIGEELDKEQAAILENKSRGLGLLKSDEGDPPDPWYGGKIQQVVQLVPYADTFDFHLLPLQKRRSTRLARFLSSRRIIQVAIDKDLSMKQREGIILFFRQMFILGGRTFVPLPPKDRTFYLVEVNQDYERVSQEWCGDQYRMSFGQILAWHNPWELNSNQPITKYFNRIQLALSNSVPLVELEETDIMDDEKDIVADDWSSEDPNPPSYKVMTDGSGLCPGSVLKAVSDLGYSRRRPVTIQARLAGAKGLWVLQPHDSPSPSQSKPVVPKVRIRQSQIKIKLPRPLDRAHRIIDLVQPARPFHSSSRVSLSRQSILNLSHNGVPNEAFVNLMETGYDDLIRPLMDWSGTVPLMGLRSKVDDAGSVARARLARLSPGLSRVHGFSGRDWKDDSQEVLDSVDESEFDEDVRDASRNEHSGAPLSLAESIVELLDAGFHPAELPLLRDQLGYFIDALLSSATKDIKVPLPLGRAISGAFAVPDPLGILEPNEIFYKSSDAMVDPETGAEYHCVTGDALIGRYPMRLPSDVHKVTAVDRPELSEWLNVLIVSTKGSSEFADEGGLRSLISKLANGDVDGDEPSLIMEPTLVKEFHSQRLTPPPPGFPGILFDRSTETVKEVTEELRSLPNLREAQIAFQKKSASCLANGKVGIYSKKHDESVDQYGYGHPRSILLAHATSTLLDASKTGHRMRKDVSFEYKNVPPQLPIHTPILQALAHAGREIAERHTEAFKHQCHTQSDIARGTEWLERDPVLVAPYVDALKRRKHPDLCEQIKRIKVAELERIETHVERVYEQFKLKAFAYPREPPTRPKKGQAKDEVMYPVTVSFSHPIAGILDMSPQDVDRVKAAYAYIKSERFGFTVAYKTLLEIKADSIPGGRAPVTRQADMLKSIPRSARLVL